MEFIEHDSIASTDLVPPRWPRRLNIIPGSDVSAEANCDRKYIHSRNE